MKTTKTILESDKSFKNWEKIFSQEFTSILNSLDWDKEIVSIISHRADDAEKRFTKETGVQCFSELRKMRKNGVAVVARVSDRFDKTLAFVK